MSQRRQSRHFRNWGGGLLILCLVLSGHTAQAQQDPVEDLRQALFIRSHESRNPTPAILEHRRKNLEKRIAALRTFRDLRRALMEWKATIDQTSSVKLIELDEEMRTLLGTRFTKALEEAARSDNPDRRLAAANSIAEMGPTIRSLKPLDFGGFSRDLAPIVIKLAGDEDLAVCQEALRALGNINADPKLAVPTFEKFLKSDRRQGPSRLAAQGLVQMIRVVSHLQKKGQSRGLVQATQRELVETSVIAVKAARAGLTSPDTQVRLLCLEVIREVANAFGDLPGPYEKSIFPPEDRVPTKEENEFIEGEYLKVKNNLKELDPVLQILAERVGDLNQALHDVQPAVKLKAIAALGEISHVRLRLKQRITSLPPRGKVLPTQDKELADPLDGLMVKALPQVIPLLADPDLQVQLKSLEFVENLEDDGIPAIPSLVVRLGDRYRFVRLQAARILGNFPPAQVKDAVPGLAALLKDDDLDVRVTVARALENMGPFARGAVGPLTHSILQGDSPARTASMYALKSIGPAQAKIAIPNLIKCLDYQVSPDARVRRVAAEILGHFGPLAISAVDALRQALGDEDAEVRTNAGDALLDILGPPGKKN